MQINDSAKVDFWSTLRGLAGWGVGVGPGDLALTMAGNLPVSHATKPVPAGPSFSASRDILSAQLGLNGADIGRIQGDTVASETQKRQALIPLIQQQLDLTNRLAVSKFGAGWTGEMNSLSAKASAGNITDEELTRYQEMVGLHQKIMDIDNERLKNIDTPLAALWREMGDTTTMVSQTLAGSVSSAVSGIASDVFAAQKGTQSWGQAWTNLKDLALQTLSQLITKMLLVKALNAALGWFGAVTGGSGSSSNVPMIAGAGGGTFLTNGPTHFTVGDNPGGIEMVSVTPISGVGQTTVNGRAMKMAGGGTAFVGGARAAAGIVVNQAINVSTGLAGSIRAEMVSMIPMFRSLAVDSVREAMARGNI